MLNPKQELDEQRALSERLAAEALETIYLESLDPENPYPLQLTSAARPVRAVAERLYYERYPDYVSDGVVSLRGLNRRRAVPKPPKFLPGTIDTALERLSTQSRANPSPRVVFVPRQYRRALTEQERDVYQYMPSIALMQFLLELEEPVFFNG